MTNLEIGLEYVTRFINTDFEGGLALARDDAVFQAPDGKIFNKEQMRDLFKDMKPRLSGPGTITIVGTTCEGNRVAIESKGETALKNGGTYRNHYHYAIEVENGSITSVGSYCCSKAMDVVYA